MNKVKAPPNPPRRHEVGTFSRRGGLKSQDAFLGTKSGNVKSGLGVFAILLKINLMLVMYLKISNIKLKYAYNTNY